MRILLPAQELQLLSVIRPGEPFGARDRALIRFAVHTGLRSAELCGLNVGDVYTWDGFAREWVEVLGKGGHQRQVPLNSVARQAVIDIVHFNRSRGFAVAGESPLLVTRCHKEVVPGVVESTSRAGRRWFIGSDWSPALAVSRSYQDRWAVLAEGDLLAT